MKVKGKLVIIVLNYMIKNYAMKAYGEWRYSSTYSWPRQWFEVSGQLHFPAAVTPGENASDTREAV
jgi:hypothetical protein